MVNGFPSAVTSIPGSEVTVTASNINVSTDASAVTNFEFDEPIFLEGLRDYCFVVQTNTSKYKLFAAQGDTFVLGSTESQYLITCSLRPIIFDASLMLRYFFI